MTAEELISSGILESYLLGNASAGEISLVQEMEKLHPSVRAELDAIEANLLSYAEEFSEPVPQLESRIKSRIFKKTAATVVQMDQQDSRRSTLVKMGIAAGVALLAGSLITNFVLFSNLRYTSRSTANLRIENQRMDSVMTVQQKQMADIGSQMQLMADPSSHMVQLKGLNPSPTSTAMVMWNEKQKAVYLHVNWLPPAPAGKQYQLWAIVNGQPVDAGLIDLNTDTSQFHKMKDLAQAQAFAVTLEKEGGSPQPTLEAMFLMGNV